jgi:hypothetical protein
MMMQRVFLFPGLRHIGYDSGFSIPLRAEVQCCPDLYAEIILFSEGRLITRRELALENQRAIFYRGWDADWFSEPLPALGDELYCVRLRSHSVPQLALPSTEIEAQMLFLHKNNGGVSSVLTGMVPMRSSGYRFAPIIHTAHYIASEPEVETITLFMNIKDINHVAPLEAGVLNAEVSTRSGDYIGTIQYPVKGNATMAISSDDLIKGLDLSEDQSKRGINVKFWGGASQFSILTIYRHRQNGSIGLEHSLAPLYYLPDLLNPAVRALVYQQLELRS